MSEKVNLQQKIQQYRRLNPKSKNLSDEQILSIMSKNGEITLTEEQKNSLYSNSKSINKNNGTKLEKESKQISINLQSGRKIVLQDGVVKYYAADGADFNNAILRDDYNWNEFLISEASISDIYTTHLDLIPEEYLKIASNPNNDYVIVLMYE